LIPYIAPSLAHDPIQADAPAVGLAGVFRWRRWRHAKLREHLMDEGEVARSTRVHPPVLKEHVRRLEIDAAVVEQRGHGLVHSIGDVVVVANVHALLTFGCVHHMLYVTDVPQNILLLVVAERSSLLLEKVTGVVGEAALLLTRSDSAGILIANRVSAQVPTCVKALLLQLLSLDLVSSEALRHVLASNRA